MRTVHLVVIVAIATLTSADATATAPGDLPRDARELWERVDAEHRDIPLETEVLKTWEDDGIVFNVVRFTVGVYRGRKAKLAGYYAYPKGGRDLPALVQVNGGGQKAGTHGPRKWATYGYACFNPNNGCQPWDKDARGLPNTDWGALTPGIPGDKRRSKGILAPGDGTIDDFVSPRNHQWFPRMIGVRRALSFLESRPEVDAERLAVRGHSTGGVMTVYAAVDPRVKAAVPSVGGCGFWFDEVKYVTGNLRTTQGMDDEQKDLFLRTISCQAHWAIMKCPVFFLGATNDFNSPTENVWKALNAVPHRRRNWVLAPHYNHAFNASAGIADVMWFEDHLKGRFTFPAMPTSELVLITPDGVPILRVRPDPKSALPVKAVDVYYSYERQPQVRFWADGGAVKKGECWEGRCPTFYRDEPLFAIANVTYEVDHTVRGAAETVVPELMVTSEYRRAWPEELAAAGVTPTEKRSRLIIIDDFSRGFRDWTGSPTKGKGWHMTTRKLSDPRWVGPKGATLAFDAHSPAPGNWLGLKVFRRFHGQNSGHAMYFAFVRLEKTGWNALSLRASEFTNIYGQELDDWHKAMSVMFQDGEAAAREKKRLLPRASGRRERLTRVRPRLSFVHVGD